MLASKAALVVHFWAGSIIGPMDRPTVTFGVACTILKPVAEMHHMVSSTLAPLYRVFGLKLGCSGAAAPIGDKVL